MKQFKDSSGRDWSIVVNVGTAKAVRDLTAVNLFDLYTTEASKVFSDPILLVNVLYAICQKQCQERGVDDYSFGASLTGDSVEAASTALLEEVADFFPSSRRTILRTALEKTGQAVTKKLEEAKAAVDQMTVDDLVKAMDTKSPAK